MIYVEDLTNQISTNSKPKQFKLTITNWTNHQEPINELNSRVNNNKQKIKKLLTKKRITNNSGRNIHGLSVDYDFEDNDKKYLICRLQEILPDGNLMFAGFISAALHFKSDLDYTVHINMVNIFSKYRGRKLCNLMFGKLIMYIENLAIIIKKNFLFVELENVGGKPACKCYTYTMEKLGYKIFKDINDESYGINSINSTICENDNNNNMNIKMIFQKEIQPDLV
jgi:hypothetical protein